MTVQGRDASNFDGALSYAGLGFLTHKVTEGTGIIHDQYGPRLAAARDAGVPVLGSYHVLRTPGSGGAGSLAAQLAFWVREMDIRTPWWRTVPFMLQVDAERWPYDNVSPATVLGFAQLLATSGLPGYPITYASRGQYGDSLRGIATDLWNADYRGSANGSYPGDGWVSYSGQAAGWAPYSGEKPTFLQYTDRPYDKDAYAGSLAELLALVGGTNQNGASTMGLDPAEAAEIIGGSLDPKNVLHADLRAIRDSADPAVLALPFAKDMRPAPGLKQLGDQLDAILAQARANGAGLTELKQSLASLTTGGVDLDALAAKVAPLVIAGIAAQLDDGAKAVLAELARAAAAANAVLNPPV